MAGAIEPRYGVRTDTSEAGDICIYQDQPGEREQVIILHLDEAKALIKLLEAEIKQAAQA